MESIFRKRAAGYLAALGGIGAVTAVCTPFHDRLHETTVALALLIVVLLIAAVWGSRPALVASVLGMLGFNFFLQAAPTLPIENPEDWIALSAFLITAITAGQLSAQAKRRAAEAEAGQKELLRINRAQRALSSSNEALVRATDESALLQQVCRIIVEKAGYRFCWVGRAESDEAKRVTPIAQAGFEQGYLKTVNVTWADVERGRGPTGTCIRTGKIQVARDFAMDPRLRLWRLDALERGYASSLAIPLVVDSQIFGALTIYSSEIGAFREEEEQLLSELADDLGFGITGLHTLAERRRAEEEVRRLNAELEQRVRARTAELQAATTALEQAREREMEIGFRIQQTLLLDPPPQDLPGLCVAAQTIPSQKIDGDFYIFIRHSEECLDVIVGDVMGKGVPAALLGAATKSHFLKALRDLAVLSNGHRVPEPKDIVMLTHAQLARQLIDLDSFVTLCYGRLDVGRGCLTLVDCGHTGILLLRGRTGLCEILHGDNLPLGVREGEIYDQTSTPIEAGDLLLFYSDGITEARSRAGELFGEERLEQFIAGHARLSPDTLVGAVRQTVFSFSESGRLMDDLTTVAIRVGEKPVPVDRAEIEISSHLAHLHEAREFVRGFCSNLSGQKMEEDSVESLALAVNEAVSNIMKHAYRGRSDQRIQLEAEAFEDHVSIRLHHLGDPFDPALVPAPIFDGSKESGFGVHIISRTVDGVRYQRDEQGRNCIALEKIR